MSAEFSIPASSLDAAGRNFRFPVRAAWVRGVLEGGEVGPSDREGELDVRLSKSGNDVVVHGRLKAELVAPCARCLEPVTITIDEPVSALMVPAAMVKVQGKPGDKPDKNEYEFSSEEADTFPYDGETVVLDDLVRDELVLETPMIPLCREDCPGISPSPATTPTAEAEQADIDPRLLPLLRLKQQAPAQADSRRTSTKKKE